MKVYCIDNTPVGAAWLEFYVLTSAYKRHAERGDRTIWKRTETLRYIDQDRVERLNCNQCKHKLACLIDPKCDKRFESK